MHIRRLSTNSLILASSSLVTALLAIALTLIIARGLGGAALGRYAAVMAWVMPLTLLVEAGYSSLITRDVAQAPGQAAAYLRAGYRLRLLLGGAVVALVWLAAPLLTGDAQVATGLRIAVWLVVIDTLFGNFTAVFRAWELMWPVGLLNIGLLGMQVLGAALVVWRGGDVLALLAAIVAADAVQLALTWATWRRLRRRHGTTEPPPPLALLALLRKTGPFMVAGVLATLHMRGIILILEQLEAPTVVGWYAAAHRAMEAARMLPQAAFGALFPALAGLVARPAAMRRVFRVAISAVLVYGGAGWLAALLFGEQAIRLAFGAEFAPAAGVFTLLMAGLLFGLLRGTLTLWLYAHHREGLVNWLLLGGVLLQLAGGPLLIRWMGVTGAAWTVLVAEGLVMLAMLGVIWRGDWRQTKPA